MNNRTPDIAEAEATQRLEAVTAEVVLPRAVTIAPRARHGAATPAVVDRTGVGDRTAVAAEAIPAAIRVSCNSPDYFRGPGMPGPFFFGSVLVERLRGRIE